MQNPGLGNNSSLIVDRHARSVLRARTHARTVTYALRHAGTNKSLGKKGPNPTSTPAHTPANTATSACAVTFTPASVSTPTPAPTPANTGPNASTSTLTFTSSFTYILVNASTSASVCPLFVLHYGLRLLKTIAESEKLSSDQSALHALQASPYADSDAEPTELAYNKTRVYQKK